MKFSNTAMVLLALMGLFGASPLRAEGLTICIEHQTTLDEDTVKVFEKELSEIARASGLPLRLVRQMSECEQIRIRIQSIATTEISALGATRVTNGRIQPEIEIYATTISKLLRSTLPVLVGRAMARVAAHEIGHYIEQSGTHSTDHNDLMAEYYTAAHLMAAGKKSNRIPLVARADARASLRK